VAAVKNKLDSGYGGIQSGFVDPNPAPVAGSTLIHNTGTTMNDLPMTTGAGDANTDNSMFAWMALIGAGLFPTTAGLDTSRWATAVAMDKTQAVQWSRYQSFWTAQFEKMVEIVLLSAETWGRAEFEDKTATVSIDSLSLVDFPGVVGPIAQMLNAIGGFIADGTITKQAGRQIIRDYIKPTLMALGADGLDETLSNEILEILTPEEREKLKKEAEEQAAAQAAQPPVEVPTEEAVRYHNGMQELALQYMLKNRIAEKAGSNGRPTETK
jgi:hypothetical protein